ncbi:hypothetical protein JET89_24020 [Pseudomonas aeruginosa]|uniref:hypothetical protein n=1 Tax=Pseudomonas aeruginosa TaxID=287 RepID=UPI000A83863F|nr:hypothetical protein [Pseudomonas aeruginosa]EKN9654593.1 hypothetical protein [Pseudomonas aeruginosa]EKV3034301.1 hypothetical protein [Pseudomonas aeruginosa]EKV3072675.1 hypothetical protein [Pseudomonas aeruginosa]EKW8035935.1 hypothetical protein [Pseudomonas aeruginosa]EMB4306266.1 hypothetical protein [Pseudomonas aeruginosa]
MSNQKQSDSSFEEIMEAKRLNRERYLQAIEQAPPELREAAAERLREAMRKPEGEPRRQRLGPPAFYKPGK